MTFEDFMLKVSYGTWVHAIAPNRDLKIPADTLTCMPASYFNSPADDIKSFTEKYSNWSVHGIRIDTINDQPTVCVTLYPN